jgi:hypothetical protein
VKTKHGIFIEIITDITQELGANSKFKGNLLWIVKQYDFSSFKSRHSLVEDKFGFL